MPSARPLYTVLNIVQLRVCLALTPCGQSALRPSGQLCRFRYVTCRRWSRSLFERSTWSEPFKTRTLSARRPDAINRFERKLQVHRSFLLRPPARPTVLILFNIGASQETWWLVIQLQPSQGRTVKSEVFKSRTSTRVISNTLFKSEVKPHRDWNIASYLQVCLLRISNRLHYKWIVCNLTFRSSVNAELTIHSWSLRFTLYLLR